MNAKNKKEKLIEQMNNYAQYAKTEAVTTEVFMSCVRELVFTMSDILKDEDAEFYAPCNDGGPLTWDEDGRYFLPMYVQEEQIPEGYEYVPVHPYLVFKTVYDCKEEKDGLFAGVIINPGCDNVFAFESFILDAAVCRYLGFDRFVYINGETGEERVLWDSREATCHTIEA